MVSGERRVDTGLGLEDLARWSKATSRPSLQPAIYGEQLNNIFHYGKAGVGKTAAIRFLLNKLQNDADKYDDLTVYSQIVNCDGTDSSYRRRRTRRPPPRHRQPS